VSISADYADDFTDGTTEDSIDFCASRHAPKAYGDDTHPANFVSLFTHKAEPDVGPIVFPPKVIGFWTMQAFDRSDIMNTKQKLELTASWSTKKELSKEELASVSALTSHTHNAEIAVATSAEYSGFFVGGAASMSALYGYEYTHEKSAAFQTKVSTLASEAFAQKVTITKDIDIPMKGPGDTETVNVWYFQTQVIAPGIHGSAGEWQAAKHFVTSYTPVTYGCGHHIPPNCLPGYCDPYDHNCWDCTTKWATIDPDFVKPLQCAEAGEGGYYEPIEESECPRPNDCRALPPCNEQNACNEMCQADRPMRGWPGDSYKIKNCYDEFDVFRWRCSEFFA